MSKLRVHELARELGRQNREVIEFLKSKGVDVRSQIGDSQDRRKGCNSKIRRR